MVQNSKDSIENFFKKMKQAGDISSRSKSQHLLQISNQEQLNESEKSSKKRSSNQRESFSQNSKNLFENSLKKGFQINVRNKTCSKSQFSLYKKSEGENLKLNGSEMSIGQKMNNSSSINDLQRSFNFKSSDYGVSGKKDCSKGNYWETITVIQTN